ncbi:MAG TPA: helix-turn-helix domain-containing protein [Anaeromyxobacter sp.]|nr:helix-turn-helix domain-containing protein [Anaeromyxobacter sp.]
MGRHKVVSDDDVLAAARRIFRERGHTASTRDVARVAGVSQAVLYQRFGSKEQLFFRAMAPTAPDLEEMLGPAEPEGEAHAYVRAVVERLAAYFSELLPVAIQLMLHPSFELETLHRFEHLNADARLAAALTRRLQGFERRGELAPGSAAAAATLITTLAHDLGLRSVLSPREAASGRRELGRMIDVIWSGVAPAGARAARGARARGTRAPAAE